jgi:hypothetical protein
LAQEKLSTFKTVKDYENWLKQIGVLRNGLMQANFDKGITIEWWYIGGKNDSATRSTATDTLKIFFMNR